jgi:hypothetical protein
MNFTADIAKMQEDMQKRHQAVLHMIEDRSDGTSSDRASSVRIPLFHSSSSATSG